MSHHILIYVFKMVKEKHSDHEDQGKYTLIKLEEGHFKTF